MTEADPAPVTPATRDQVAEWYRAGVITVHSTPWHRDDLAAQWMDWEPPCPT